MSRAGRLFLFLMSWLCLAGVGNATSLKDVKIAVRVLDFVTNPIQGRAVVGIAYDPRKEESAQDAQAILGWISAGNGPRKSDWTPQLVDIRNLGGMTGMRAVFIAAGMDRYYDEIADYGRRNTTLTIGFDVNCAHTAKCVVGITTASRIEVLLSFSAAAANDIQFSEAFRMMVTEY